MCNQAKRLDTVAFLDLGFWKMIKVLVHPL